MPVEQDLVFGNQNRVEGRFESSIKVGQTGVWPVDFCNADKLLGFGMVGLEIEVVRGCDWFRLW